VVGTFRAALDLTLVEVFVSSCFVRCIRRLMIAWRRATLDFVYDGFVFGLRL
jgi:hypothetical protein